jgi:protein-L-isoaspartate(D-aspartate) O-methyltransferase
MCLTKQSWAIGLVAMAFLIAAGWPAREIAAQSRDRFGELRQRMVSEYIESEGIRNSKVLEAMRQVPRHEFVRPQQRRQAYEDRALAIGYRQTISPPFVVAYMTETIDPAPSDRVLEIGTGSGYQAAVLSGLVSEVFTIEIVKELGNTARKRLARLGYKNVTTRIGDGYQGWPGKAPFDKIIVTCSPENVPRPLVDQLKEGGRMIIPLGQRYQQVFHLYEKREGRLVESKLISTLFVPMTGISEEQRTLKPNPLNPRIVNAGFELDNDGDGRPDSWHYQRQSKLTDGQAPQGSRYLRLQNSEPGRPAHILQGMAIDGRRISTLDVAVMVKIENTAEGPKPFQKPGLVIHFYDSARRPIGEGVLGPWIGSSRWQFQSKAIRVPAQAREAILRIGLNGATGTLSVDQVRLVRKGSR